MSPTIRGMILMALAALAMGSVTIVIRHVSADIHAFEIAFFRSLFGLAAFAPVFVRHRLRPLATRRFGLHAARAVFLATTMLISFWALAIGELAKVMAILFTAPLIAGVLAVAVLKEPFRWGRALAALLGLAGTLIVVRPGAAEIDLGTGLALVAAVTWACELLTIKLLVRTESSVTTTIYMGMLGTPLILLATLPIWRMPEGETLLWLALLGALATLGHLGATQAFKLADMSVVLPLSFTQIAWVGLFGAIFFGQQPAAALWIGSGLIVLAGTLNAVLEGRRREEKRRPAAPP